MRCWVQRIVGDEPRGQRDKTILARVRGVSAILGWMSASKIWVGVRGMISDHLGWVTGGYIWVEKEGLVRIWCIIASRSEGVETRTEGLFVSQVGGMLDGIRTWLPDRLLGEGTRSGIDKTLRSLEGLRR